MRKSFNYNYYGINGVLCVCVCVLCAHKCAQCLRGLTRLRAGSVCFGILRRFFGRGGITDGVVT